MKKQFESKEDLQKWIEKNFPEEEKEWTFENVAESMFECPYTEEEISKKLLSEGYDIDDLTANGEGYNICGHTNNGWFWAYEEDLKYLESVGTDMSKVRVKK
ncbi:hypothetical protein [Blautia sp.]|uniref:hypothetical protein n=1 Tax=Blautia sp. TaxID=1955243 RepID=UPI00258BAF23|nr:hypothetical protein [Blautia sp.]